MTRKRTKEIWSFFSGAMGLDLGLEQGGLFPTLANEIDKNCLTAFAEAANRVGYHIDTMSTGIVSTFQERAEAAGEGFLELLLSDSIGSNLDQQDSRTYQPPSRRSRSPRT